MLVKIGIELFLLFAIFFLISNADDNSTATEVSPEPHTTAKEIIDVTKEHEGLANDAEKLENVTVPQYEFKNCTVTDTSYSESQEKVIQTTEKSTEGTGKSSIGPEEMKDIHSETQSEHSTNATINGNSATTTGQKNITSVTEISAKTT